MLISILRLPTTVLGKTLKEANSLNVSVGSMGKVRAELMKIL